MWKARLLCGWCCRGGLLCWGLLGSCLLCGGLLCCRLLGGSLLHPSLGLGRRLLGGGGLQRSLCWSTTSGWGSVCCTAAVKKHECFTADSSVLVCSKAELKLGRRCVGNAPICMKHAHRSRIALSSPSWLQASWPGLSWPLWLLSSWPQAFWWVSSWPLWLLSSWQWPVAGSAQRVRHVSGQASGSIRSSARDLACSNKHAG